MTAAADFPDFLKPRYRALALLKQGGKGVVFKAEDTVIARIVAVKILKADSSPTDLIRFQQEAKSLSRLKHPNVVTVHDFAVEGGTPYMIMEFIEGRDLSDILSDSKEPLPVTTTVTLLLQAARGMAHAHQNGIVHRDLKPSNMIIAGGDALDSCMRIVDFGLARFSGDNLALTTAGSVVGTPNYLSPEQARGMASNEDPGFASDIYSFGCILFELLTGETVFQAETAFEVFRKHAEEAPPALPPVSPDEIVQKELETIIETCLEKDQNDRYGSFSEIEQALAAIDARLKMLEESRKKLEAKDHERTEDKTPIPYPAKEKEQIPAAVKLSLAVVAALVVAGGSLLAYVQRQAIRDRLLPARQAPVTTDRTEMQSKERKKQSKSEVSAVPDRSTVPDIDKVPDLDLSHLNWFTVRYEPPEFRYLSKQNVKALAIIDAEDDLVREHITGLSPLQLQALKVRPITGNIFPSLPSLQSLELLWIVPYKTRSQEMQLIGNLKNLKTFIVTANTDLNDAHVEALSKASTLENLYIAGSHARIGPAGLNAIAKLTNLKRLLIRAPGLKAPGLRTLLALPQLEFLAIPAARWDEEMVGMIADSKLHRLALFKNQTGPQILDGLTKNRGLRHIYFYNTALRPESSEIRSLKKKLPNCRFTTEKFLWHDIRSAPASITRGR